VSSELLAAKQHVDNLKRAHADLLADCAEVSGKITLFMHALSFILSFKKKNIFL
jgi:hypothetical protein